MKLLATFPLYSHPDVSARALQLLGEEADTFIPCNTPALAWLLEGGPHVINEVNNFCNGGWNQAMQYFLAGDWDYLVLSSQDVFLKPGWSKKIPDREKEVYVPGYAHSLDDLHDTYPREEELLGGVTGACTFLSRKAVELVYPIPYEIKLWFGDEWIYTRLRKHGWKVMQSEIAAFHYGSLSIFENSAAYPQIEADKVAWETVKGRL